MLVDDICLIVFTNGRLELLKRTIDSAEKNLQCNFSYKMIMNDCPEVSSELETFYCPRGFGIYSNLIKSGYCCSIQKAWDAIKERYRWILHLEEDFIFNEPIPVMDMIRVLEHDSRLAQMALVRQPINTIELAAGSILRATWERYTPKEWDGFEWLENNFCFTNNPCVYPIDITRYPYPQRTSWPWGEGEFSELLRNKGYQFGYWGGMEQKPKVTHIG
jgi:hypothetical protein